MKPRRRNPALSPRELAEDLASYLNTKVDPYDFGGTWLLEKWMDEDGLSIADVSVDDLNDDQRELFAEWLMAVPEGERDTRLEMERKDDPLGVPSYLYFEDAYPLGPGAWCVHFGERAFSSFERGATLPMLGLSTHYKMKAQATCDGRYPNLDSDISPDDRVYGFAFAVAELAYPSARRAAQRKYGKVGVLFQTDAAVSAYHVTDDERQVIFPLCSESNVVEVKFHEEGGVEIPSLDMTFDSLAEATAFLETQSPS